jgi:hypothetical protein
LIHMKTIHTTTILACLTMLHSPILAQQPERQGHGGPPSPLLFLFDEDQDGVISADEIEAASAALQTLDADGDGKLTIDELRPPRPPQGPQGPQGHRPPPVIAALDQDQDGRLSAAELDAAPESLRELDLDQDGELSPEELRPQGPPPAPADKGKPARHPDVQPEPGTNLGE